MRNPLLYARVFNTPLLVAEDKMAAVLHALSARDAWFAETSAPSAPIPVAESESDDVEIPARIGVIPIHGLLASRLTQVQAASGGPTTYTDIARMAEWMRADPGIARVVLDIDSPGGEAALLDDAFQALRELSAVKPVTAYIHDTATSAAYWLATAADRIVVAPHGRAGSIGVVVTHADMSKKLENEGVTVTHIYAGKHKVDGSPVQALSEQARSAFAAEVDYLYDRFVSSVAERRGVSEEQIRNTEARVYRADQAVELSLVDEVASFRLFIEQEMSMFTRKAPAEATPLEDTEMRIEEPTTDQAQLDEMLAQARTEERERIFAILDSDSAKFHSATAMKLAFELQLPAAQALAVLESLPPPATLNEAPNQSEFAQRMSELGNPKLHAGAVQPSEEDEMADVIRMFRNGR